MDRQRIGGIEVTRIVEIEGANSPRFTGYLFPELTAEHLAAQALELLVLGHATNARQREERGHALEVLLLPVGFVEVVVALGTLDLHAEEVLRDKQRLIDLIAKCTGKDAEQVALDTERDHYLNAAEAHEYGIVDEILDEDSSKKTDAEKEKK